MGSRMKFENLQLRTARFKDGEITIERIVCEAGNTVAERADHLRFIYSSDAFVLDTGSEEQFVAERSVVKVHPGVPVQATIKRGHIIYEIGHLRSEQDVVDELRSKEFPNLPGDCAERWETAKNKGLDFIAYEKHPNAHNIVTLLGIIIAPPHCRRNHMLGNGWYLTFDVASKALAVGGDLLFKPRPEETMHTHSRTTEIYTCMKGVLGLEIDGQEVPLRQYQAISPDFGEYHGIKRVISAEDGVPYEGLTLQSPGLPADRIDK